MSKYFAKRGIDNRFYDLVWHKSKTNDGRKYILKGHYGGYDGIEKLVVSIGELWWSARFGWTAISHADDNVLHGLRMVEGFKTRWLASSYLLDVGFC